MTFKVSSLPLGAEVVLLRPGEGTETVLGKTPYLAEKSDLSKMASRGHVVVLVRKTGYESQSFLLPNWTAGHVDIEARLALRSQEATSARTNALLKLFLEGERLLSEGRAQAVLDLCARIRESEPDIAAVFALEAMAHFVSGAFDKSRLSLLQALDLDPEDKEALRMLKEVDRRLQRFDNPTTPSESSR